jgi:transcriptional regulator with XRE-family HTH domain
VPSSSDDWQRLADKVRTRRGALGLTQTQVAEAAGIESRTLGSIENKPRPRRAATLGGLERALGWTEGSIRQVLNGGEPIMTGDEYEIEVQRHGSKQDVYAKLEELPEDDAALAAINAILDDAVARARRRNAK